MLPSGYTEINGAGVRYEYRYRISDRDSSTVRLVLELRLIPSEDVYGRVAHMTFAYPDGRRAAKSSFNVVLSDDVLPANVETSWMTMFDGKVTMRTSDSVLDVEVGFSENQMSILEDGYDIGEYRRPDGIMAVSVSPFKIDVAAQNDASVTANWMPSNGASYYRVYLNVEKNMTGVQLVDARCVATSISFNPKQEMIGGISWKSARIESGYTLYVGVESYDESDVSSGSVVWSEAILYDEVECLAPSNCYVIGKLGEPNKLSCFGETARLYYRGGRDGSYTVEQFALRRQDGLELKWSKADEKVDAIGRHVELNFSSWKNVGESVQFELRAYDLLGRPVYSESGFWTKFSAIFCGGFVNVYGRQEWLDESGEEQWRNGLCWVYDGSQWKRARAVHVRTDSGWKTL